MDEDREGGEESEDGGGEGEDIVDGGAVEEADEEGEGRVPVEILCDLRIIQEREKFFALICKDVREIKSGGATAGKLAGG